MAKYKVGPSTLHLTGHQEPAAPDSIVEHDFSVNGPDGEHGPAREASLIAAGALTLVPDQPSARRRAEPAPSQE